MVLFKLIVFALVAAVIYRWMGGKLPFIDRSPAPKKTKKVDQIETASACATCGVYVTESDAIIYQRKVYCSQACLNAAKKE